MAYYVEGDFDRTLRNFQDGMRAMIPILEERQRDTDPKVRPFIEADLARVRDFAGDLPAPVPTAADQREIDRLSPQQRELLTAVLNGKTTYGGTERWTVEALQRRQFLTVTIDENQRFPNRNCTSPATVRNSPRSSLNPPSAMREGARRGSRGYARSL